MIQRPHLFYGWYIVGLAIVGMMLIYGIRNSFSVFFVPILDEFDWYRGSTAIMLSLNILVYGFTALVAGSLVDRWKPRKVATIGIIVLTLATAGCSYARELWHFYLLFGVLAPIGSAFCGAPILNPTLMHWFHKRRGLAIGLGQIGGSLSFTYGMFIEFVISHLGWRLAFFVMAGLLIVVLLPLYAFFFYHRPEDRGLKAYGTGEPLADEGIKGVENLGVRDWTLGSAARSYHLWLLVLSQFCYWGTGNYMVLAHQIKFAVDAGYSSTLATSVFALFGIASIGGQLCAFISDSIGRERTVTLATILAIGALVALISVRDASQLWLLYVFAICSGFATGLFSPTIFVGLADIFHGRNIGAISGMVLLGTGVGGALGPWLGGYIYDVSGSYNIAFIISMASFGVACISFWIAAPRHAARLRARR
jgi:sugar phosphate permease